MEKQLKEKLFALDYSEDEVEMYINDSKKMDKKLLDYLYLWVLKDIETEVVIDGVSTEWLKEFKGMSYPAAILSLNWVLEDKNIAKKVLIQPYL